MPFLYIPGNYRPDVGRPDGDSIRFLADDLALLDQIEDRDPNLGTENTVQLRYEGIDTLESDAILPFSEDATRQNITLVGANPDDREPAPGFILSRILDGNRRPLCFVFPGTVDPPDNLDGQPAQPGDQIFLDEDLLQQSVNFQLLSGGFAYPFFFESFFADLRQVMRDETQHARSNNQRLWAADGTNSGFTFPAADELENTPPIFPRLYRRLRDFGDRPIGDFLAFIERRNIRLITIPDAQFINFEDVIEIQDNEIRLTHMPEDLVFLR